MASARSDGKSMCAGLQTMRPAPETRERQRSEQVGAGWPSRGTEASRASRNAATDLPLAWAVRGGAGGGSVRTWIASRRRRRPSATLRF